jgi:pyruvate/2-oxoglutarate dehydrogenase complex dihydrolipoamide acyltransferase (E2) component
VAAGDQLGEIETDKATMSFDSTEDGFIAKHLVEAGTECLLGACILRLRVCAAMLNFFFVLTASGVISSRAHTTRF